MCTFDTGNYSKAGTVQKHPCSKISTCRCSNRCFCSYILRVVITFVIVTIAVVKSVNVVVSIPVSVSLAIVSYRMIALVLFLAHSINRYLP